MFERLVAKADATHQAIGRAHLDLMRLIVEIDRSQAWQDSGARDTAHWLSMRYGLSSWKAYRWIAAAHKLETLPLISEALAGGEIGIDKVVELTRFATPDDEARLLSWAGEVSCASVRRRADIEARTSRAELLEAERDRSVAGGTTTTADASGWRRTFRPPTGRSSRERSSTWRGRSP